MKMKLLYIEWEDASAMTGWNHTEEVERMATDYMIANVGWLVKETDKYLILTEGLCLKTGGYNTLHKIPKAYIRIRKVITQKNIPQMVLED